MPASLLAFVSSLHVGLALLRYHRSGTGAVGVLLVSISTLFVGLPWLAATPLELVLGVGAHIAWLGGAEVIDRRVRARREAAAAAAKAAAAPPTLRVVGPRASAPAPEPPAPAPRPSGFTPLPVIGVVDETADIRTFRVARPDGFDFQAGQFIAVRVRIDQKDHVRCYSISSSPEAPGYLEISVKRQGLVSSALHATMRTGGVLHARPPAGTFVYPEGDDRLLVLVAGGVGITPMISMLRHGLATEPQRPFVMLHAARAVSGLAFADELKMLSRRWRSFQWLPAVSSPGAPSFCYPGRLDAHAITAAVPQPADALYYMCGPSSMIDGVRATLLALGVPDAQVRFERFEAAIAAVGAQSAAAAAAQAAGGGHGHAGGGARRVNGSSARVAGAATATKGSNVITFSRSNQTHHATHRDTLLDAAEACGVTIPSLCRAGVCGTCKTRVKAGDVTCDSSVLPDDEREDGYVLACVARATGACTVEA